MSARVVVFAYSEVGACCLEALLLRGAQVAGVFTYRDAPEESIWFRSVEAIARAAGIPVFFPEKLNSPENAAFVATLAPELIFSFYYRDMIGRAILDVPHLGAFNLHGSLLPKYRGRACINWAILNGETETGATLHEMVEAPDAGDIVDAERVPIGFEDTALDVSRKVAAAASRIIARSYPLLAAGAAPRRSQNAAEASYYGRRRPEDGCIDWSASAVAIHNLVRAVTHPWPGAFSTLSGRKLFVWKAFPQEGAAAPGRVLSLDPLLVGTGAGTLRIDRAQIEGAEETDGASLARAHLRVGDEISRS